MKDIQKCIQIFVPSASKTHSPSLIQSTAFTQSQTATLPAATLQVAPERHGSGMHGS